MHLFKKYRETSRDLINYLQTTEGSLHLKQHQQQHTSTFLKHQIFSLGRTVYLGEGESN